MRAQGRKERVVAPSVGRVSTEDRQRDMVETEMKEDTCVWQSFRSVWTRG